MASSGQNVAAESKFYEIPAIRVDHFGGRKYLLDRIGKFFKEGASVVVLIGMGGQGKTQLSLEYCRAKRTENSIFWVDATSVGTVNRSFDGIALKLEPGSTFLNPEAARTFVLKKLEGLSDPVLMIFDNYDKPTEFPTIRDYLPRCSKIILNSRHTDAKRLGKDIEIGAMTAEEGVELLLFQSGYERTEETVEEARQIVGTLGGLALAIDQAATYIKAQNIPLSSFAEAFAKRRTAILKRTPSEYSKSRLEDCIPSSVFTTWEMCLEQLQVTNDKRGSLVHLLTLGAFIDTRDISEGLFSLYAQQDNGPRWLEYFMDGSKWASEKYQASIVSLQRISLVTGIDPTGTDSRFSFHPLIAEWLKLRVDYKVRDEYIEEAIHVVRLFVDNGDRKQMPIRDKGEMLSHLDAVIAGDELLHTKGHQASKTLQDAMVSFGSFYRRLGRYQETKHLIERALQNDHKVTPKIRNVLANMYCDRGDLIEAENLYTQILIDLKETLPTKDPDDYLRNTLRVRLGVFYWTQDDKLDASGTKLEGVHPCDYSAFDPWFVSALSAKNGLAIVYMKQGRLETAETLFKRVLEGREKASGVEDCKTLEVVNHLGALEILKGYKIAAERLLLRALAGIEKQYGPGHTKTQMIYSNLGLCYLESAQYKKAENYLNLAARNLEDALGPAHPFTLTAFHNQGLLHLTQKKHPAAKAKFERAIEGWEAGCEGATKSAADSMYCLGTVYEKMEDKRLYAEMFLREAERLYERALGEEHLLTVEAGKRADQVRDGII